VTYITIAGMGQEWIIFVITFAVKIAALYLYLPRSEFQEMKSSAGMNFMKMIRPTPGTGNF